MPLKCQGLDSQVPDMKLLGRLTAGGPANFGGWPYGGRHDFDPLRCSSVLPSRPKGHSRTLPALSTAHHVHRESLGVGSLGWLLVTTGRTGSRPLSRLLNLICSKSGRPGAGFQACFVTHRAWDGLLGAWFVTHRARGWTFRGLGRGRKGVVRGSGHPETCGTGPRNSFGTLAGPGGAHRGQSSQASL